MNRYTLVDGKLEPSENGELVRFEDVAPLERRAGAAESRLVDLEPQLERATKEHEAVLELADERQAEIDALKVAHNIELAALRDEVQAANDELERRRGIIDELRGALDLIGAEIQRVRPPAPPVPQEQLEQLARSFVEQLGKAIKG